MTGRGKRALVTGATGFVGSRLVRHLLAEGWSVDVVARPASSRAQLAAVLARVRVHVHGGTTAELVETVRAARPDTVFHLAAKFVGDHASADVEPLLRANVVFGAQLLEAMDAAGAARLVNTGSAWQHGAGGTANLYAATKQAFQALLDYYVSADRMAALTLVLYDTYGPGDPRPKLLAALVGAAGGAAPLEMSPGEQQLDLVYIDDVVRAYTVAARLLEAQPPGTARTYAVRSGRARSVREIAECVQRVLGKRLEIAWGARPYRRCEVMRPWEGGEGLPSWSATVELEEGIGRLAGTPMGAV